MTDPVFWHYLIALTVTTVILLAAGIGALTYIRPWPHDLEEHAND